MGNSRTTARSLLNSGHNECNFLQIPLFKITRIICKPNSAEKVLKKLPLNTFAWVKNCYAEKTELYFQLDNAYC